MEEAINGMRPKSGGTPSAPAPQPSAHGARVFGAISQERFMSERVYGFEDEEDPAGGAPPPAPPRTERTRRVPPPVLNGHAASLPPY